MTTPETITLLNVPILPVLMASIVVSTGASSEEEDDEDWGASDELGEDETGSDEGAGVALEEELPPPEQAANSKQAANGNIRVVFFMYGLPFLLGWIYRSIPYMYTGIMIGSLGV